MSCYILTWKPEAGTYSIKDFNKLKVDLRLNGSVDSNWRMRTTEAQKGDQAIFFRQGEETGVVGFGEIVGDGFLDDQGSRRYPVRIFNLRDSFETPYILKDELVKVGIKESALNTQASGNSPLSNTDIASIDSMCRDKFSKSLSDMCLGYIF